MRSTLFHRYCLDKCRRATRKTTKLNINERTGQTVLRQGLAREVRGRTFLGSSRFNTSSRFCENTLVRRSIIHLFKVSLVLVSSTSILSGKSRSIRVYKTRLFSFFRDRLPANANYLCRRDWEREEDGGTIVLTSAINKISMISTSYTASL